MQMRCQQSLTRTRAHAANGIATICEEDTPECKANPSYKHKQQRPKNCLLAVIARLNFAEYFANRFCFAPTPMTALLQQTLEPTWMNKQPMSAVQPVFAHSPWQKERLTHSQPREKPRHRKETQQSWMKHNIDIASSDSKPMFFFFIVLRRMQKTQPQQKNDASVTQAETNHVQPASRSASKQLKKT